MSKSSNSSGGRDANGNVDPKGWAGKHVAREGRHTAKGQAQDKGKK